LSGYGDLATASAGGFGELGAWGPRPSGINFGFYVQLRHMGRHVAAADAAWIASAGDRAGTGNLTGASAAAGMAFGGMSGYMATGMVNNAFMQGLDVAVRTGTVAAAVEMIEPVSTLMNQFNPLMMTMNSVQNVEIASRVHGIDAGYLWEAQALNMAVAPLRAAGSALIMAGFAAEGTLIGAPVGVLLQLLGGALSAVGNSIQVNPTTGERAMKMTDSAAVNTTADVLGAFAGGYGATLSGFNPMVNVMRAAGTATTLTNAGMRYDERGNLQGWSADDRFWESAVTAGIVGAGGAALGGAAETALGLTAGTTVNVLHQL